MLMTIRAPIMDLQPEATLLRFATVESPIAAMRPVEPAYAIFSEKSRAALRRFVGVGD